MDEVVALSDTATAENAQAVRLRVDTRKWYAGKMQPKKYGDKANSEVNITNTVNVLMTSERQKELQAARMEALKR